MPKARRSNRLCVKRNTTSTTRRDLLYDSADDFLEEFSTNRSTPGTSRKGKNKESGSVTKKKSGTRKKNFTEKTKSQCNALNIDSDDEISEADLPTGVIENMRNKVKNFFDDLENKDDKKLFNNIVLPESTNISQKDNIHLSESTSNTQKNKYHITLSDSEDELCAPAQVSSYVQTAIADTSTGSNSNIEYSYATTKSSDIIIDLDDNFLDVSQENVKVDSPTLSFEDFKRQTEALLMDIDSSVRNCEKIIKPSEPVSKSPVKVTHTCPVCLEKLGDSLQAMSTVCGHLFCEPCLKQIVVTTKSCPACRKKLNKNKYHPIYL